MCISFHCNNIVIFFMFTVQLQPSFASSVPFFFSCAAQMDLASDKERPIKMMERVVNLRPDDSRQTLACRCSPSASERREYEASSLNSCTGNEMWN